MGRPANPNLPSPGYTTRDFAPDANFPAGSDPWSGQPTKVEPPGAGSTGFVPNTGAGAQFFNKLFKDGFNTQADQKTYEQGLRDAAQTKLQEILDYAAQYPVLSFRNAATGGVIGLTRLIYSPAARVWLAFGADGTGQSLALRTRDIRTWPTSNEIGAGALIAVAAPGAVAAVDASGNIVIPGSGATDGDKIAEFNQGTLTWTKRTGLFVPTFVVPDVANDPVNALWCIAGKKNGANALNVYTSPDRTTWTLRTAPVPTFDAAVGPSCTIGSDGAGTLIMRCAYNPANAGAAPNNVVGFSKSTDGGVTWSAVVNVATPFTDPTLSAKASRPVWTGTRWVTVESNNATKKTYVITSTDGTTWNIVATLTSVWIYQVISLGDGLIVGVCGDGTISGRVVFSLDGGVTWKHTDEAVNGAFLCEGAGRPMLLVTSPVAIYPGIGSGSGAAAVT